ncbi:MAG TPA: D-glycero-beta-D-manno-heptose 1-phosphate adenylyltransferase [Phycisphaerales bacterium]|nr:D-glycero-beta-D-manno-heptose 1-phosphate adenylyltransferase [Phycisphaerales bacterium]
MEALLAQLAQWRSFTALVVGDFMLDQQVFGDAERLSADAPVPILHVRRTESQPGGSANVCMDLAALGGRVQAFGVIGDDAAGRVLRESLEQHGVSADTLVRDASRPTTLKQNLVGLAQARHPQKMFRVDYESREDLSAGVVRQMTDAFDAALARTPKPDAVCIEDYNKGVCTHALCQHIITRCRSVGVPVFVDPARGVDYRKYKGATAITPNRTEAEVATGIRCDDGGSPEHNAALARRLLADLELDAVVLTLDRHGALLLEADGRSGDQRAGGTPVAIPTIARQVYDVTGAGDMFLAGLAAARANGIDWDGSVRFANAAAGLEVEVFGVQPIPFERVHHSLLMQYSHVEGKLRTLDQAKLEVAARRKQGQKVVFTNGCFDVLHSGHVALLEKAAAEGDFLIVGLNDDSSVCRLKGPTRPVNNQEDRARVLGALQSVGAVVLFSDDTPIELIRALKPDVLVKGADYTKDRVVGADIVERAGGRVALIPLVEGRSTTATIARLKS